MLRPELKGNQATAGTHMAFGRKTPLLDTRRGTLVALNLLSEKVPETVPMVYWKRLRWVRRLLRTSLAIGVVLLVGICIHASQLPATRLARDGFEIMPPYLLLQVLIVWSSVRVVRRKLVGHVRRHSLRVCMECAYPLIGLGSRGSCPECGRSFQIETVMRAWREWMGSR